jgi:regulator of CtrA degradation
MSKKPERDTGAVSFSEHLANSQVFTALFRDGMALVEETASYLDGPGRKESKRLQRSAALVYATESMRLTTRLMQLASWLLLHRAVKEGEMTLTQAKQEKVKVKLTTSPRTDEQTLAMLPQRLRDLIKHSHDVSERVIRLDATIYAPPAAASLAGNPVERQLGLLKAAFERSA